jgi:NAD+ kinase
MKTFKISPKNIGIVLKPKVVSEYTNILPTLFRWLDKRKKNVLFLEQEEPRIKKIFKEVPKGPVFVSSDKIHSQSDLIITLGGDGTLLGIARQSTRNSPPIFGINMGRLGFITEFSKGELFEELECILTKKVPVNQIPLFQAEIFSNNKKVSKSYFLNDAVFNKSAISRMFSLDIETETEHIFSLSGDGLIVSSPIGSTAYGLAAGGPIVHPDVKALTLIPICPHSLTHRPLVIADKAKVIIRVPKNSDTIQFTLDGQEVIPLSSTDYIIISKSRVRHAKFICNPNRTYYHTLKEKFTHGKRAYL